VFKERRVIFQNVPRESTDGSVEDVNPTLSVGDSLKGIKDTFKKAIDDLKKELAPSLNPILKMLGMKEWEELDPDATEEEIEIRQVRMAAAEDRLELAAELNGEFPTRFDDDTNPLKPEARPNPRMNPTKFPDPDDLPRYDRHGSGWYERHGKAVWVESEIYFPVPDMKFFNRDGYTGGSIEEYMDNRVVSVTFFGATCRVHPVMAARMAVMQSSADALGIEHHIHNLKGYKFRPMNAAGRVSNHAKGCAIDCDPGHDDDENPMEVFDSVADAYARSNYPPGLMDLAKEEAGLRTPDLWRGAGGKIDVMHLDLKCDRTGKIPSKYGPYRPGAYMSVS